ncbi:MAG: rifamycin-inactivating phosphotransferase [Actinomycetota bacterium]|nr:rifamycin-inactivating phosphotransferase [Actinomycetota bacterium]
MSSDVVDLRSIDRAQVALAGGKGANLGELTRIDGVHVPAGFCVTTDAYRRVVGDDPAIGERLDRLTALDPADRDTIAAASAEVRRLIEARTLPGDLVDSITRAVGRLDADTGFAVRSSATAEDLPTASFAGQQDSYLNVVGAMAVVDHISRCWASLFTERAVTYRLRNSIDHRTASMAVIVQEMVAADAAGVLFTADPATSNRRVTAIEAVVGLGESLVSGAAESDSYRVRDDEIVARSIATKPRTVRAVPGGGTEERPADARHRDQPALADEQVLELARLGRRIEAHVGAPQDIEWCLVDNAFAIVQSRPITTLFPVPPSDDGQPHVYVSVGHQQMMTDPMKPLGISFWQLSAGPPMHAAGGRLWVDVAPRLASPAARAAVIGALGASDPLIGDALATIVDRGDALPPPPDEAPPGPLPGGPPEPIETDPAIVTELIEQNRASVAALGRELAALSGAALLDAIGADLAELKRVLFDPRSMAVIMAGMASAEWLNEHLQEWLGETNAADTLTRSVPHNVTAEMGLALLDVADVIRPHPEVVAFLRGVDAADERFLDELAALPGGAAARDAIVDYLERYGMRCVGEIDITRTRWSEHPGALLPALLGNVDNFEPGAAARRFERGRREAEQKEREVLERLRALPHGDARADETKRMIDRVRTFAGYREYPKYGMISRYLLYKQALGREARRLVADRVIGEEDDIFFLTFAELAEVVRTDRADHALIRRRREEFASYHALTPPRVLTSDGEEVTGTYRRGDRPAGALIGVAVSTGTVEGRARVVHHLAEADVDPGDILVTRYTDPSWTPLFVTVAGLVTEVGGLMTHGAVIAREYGLPAVVGVERATELISDGERIRVHGTAGYVELLAE